MNKKRKMLLVVVFILLSLGILSFGQEEGEMSEWESCSYFGDMDEDCDDDHIVRCNKVIAADEEVSDCADEEDDPMDFINYLRSESGVRRGCPIVMSEDDSYEDDCSIAIVPIGFRLDSEKRGYDDIIITTGVWIGDEGGLDDLEDTDWDFQHGYSWRDNSDDDPYDAASCHKEKIILTSSLSYICSPDKNWKLCDEAHKGATLWGDKKYSTINFLFECNCENDFCKWEQVDSDDDRDGYTRIKDGDCEDNPDNNPVDLVCPTIDEEDYFGLTKEDVREQIKGVCNYPTQAFCAICINPGAPEICGDGINNDCGGEGAKEAHTNLDGNTPDSCHQFAAGCEKKKSLDEDSQETGPQHTNIYDEAFDWQLVRTEGNNKVGYCCGYHGIEDLGKTGTSEEGNFVCLNNQKDLVGHEGEAIAGWNEELCGNKWCWVKS